MSTSPKFTKKSEFTTKQPDATPPAKTDDQLLFEITSASESIALYTKQKKAATAELLQRREREIQQLLKAKDEPYGIVTIMIGNHEVKVDTKKDVKWNQESLRQYFKEMLADGIEPRQYIKDEYSINETAYKTWPVDMKDCFKPARTVTPGKPTLKVKDEE